MLCINLSGIQIETVEMTLLINAPDEGRKLS